MAKTAIIHARTEMTLKSDTERIFKKLGLTTTEAINLFLSQVRLRKGLPFPVEIPNAETARALKQSEQGIGLQEHASLDDMFKTLRMKCAK